MSSKNINNAYYEITSRNKNIFYISIFKSYYYDYDSKRYRGINKIQDMQIEKTKSGYKQILIL